MSVRPRDIRLIDALDGREGISLDEVVWRVAREGRDPTDCGSAGGRWDDTTFEVLYTSRTRDGALAEMLFHLRAGQPVVPSRLRFGLHELRVRLRNVLDLSSLPVLEALGLDTRQYGRMSYLERTAEYPRTQEIAEVAHFHGHDGLIVPSARSGASNLIVFCGRIDPDQVETIRDHGIVDWNSLP
ncbi:RES family NAD+ phosphorylase [Kumtagia ephedrae]|uniref:RES domain-containing protein n=1 Tax=Kumtagia ephedrae TaxID=2116701 RepID=A0A2P7SLF6_9HYPH|nr:RES family NAD+ phosphorylase [Mesorhizobium ephedrae]PSJ63328.1 RES domain-containing protein [Mesorhizobium ephedrae]